MEYRNRQWTLARLPRGALCEDDFRLVESPLTEPKLAPGEVLVKSLMFRLTPAMRTRMKPVERPDEQPAIIRPMKIGTPVASWVSAEIIRSNEPQLPVGTVLTVPMGWQDYAVIKPADLRPRFRIKPPDVSLEDFDSIYGGNALTAYFGLLRVGQPQAGETLVVSGAAGSAGSVAAQIGKIVGCRVIGIAGGADKCRWLRDDVGLDYAVDYKTQDVDRALHKLCPEGFQIFFDNVGGKTLDAAINNMAPFGRIALCGQIASYDDGDKGATGPSDMMRVIYWRLRLQGFLLYDYESEFDAALADLRRWVAERRIVNKVDVRHGFQNLPQAFMGLFKGANFGTALLRND
jgi:NADPH-dependent curcumin reductase CurA